MAEHIIITAKRGNNSHRRSVASWERTPAGKACRRRSDAKRKTAILEAQRLWRQSETGKESRRASKFRQKYGISLEDYERLFAKQGGRCAICQIDNPGGRWRSHFCVDHCHRTGKIRGLLCARCNTALAQFGDCKEGLLRAVQYLSG